MFLGLRNTSEGYRDQDRWTHRARDSGVDEPSEQEPPFYDKLPSNATWLYRLGVKAFNVTHRDHVQHALAKTETRLHHWAGRLGIQDPDQLPPEVRKAIVDTLAGRFGCDVRKQPDPMPQRGTVFDLRVVQMLERMEEELRVEEWN